MMNLEQLLIECAKKGLKVEKPPEYDVFNVVVRYYRGLGPEYMNLHPVCAKTIAEAETLANNQAIAFFQTEPEHVNSIINEIRIRPNQQGSEA